MSRPRLHGPLIAAAVALAALPAACSTARTQCPVGTHLTRQVYSGGGESEWCRRSDGVRQGPELRFYESGSELATGAYVDGALSGVWRYRFKDGRNWRADSWEDGALTAKTVDPSVAAMSPEALHALGWTTSGVIKLASHDPLLGRAARDAAGTAFVAHHPNGRPRVAGSYDADGLRTGVWRFWFADGRPDREIEYLAGVRERVARAWHPSGAPAVEGLYVAGEREGVWRWWDARGQLVAETTYRAGRKVAPGDGGMLAP